MKAFLEFFAIVTILSLVMNHYLRCKFLGRGISSAAILKSMQNYKNWLPLRNLNNGSKREDKLVKAINYNLLIFYFSLFVFFLVGPLLFYFA